MRRPYFHLSRRLLTVCGHAGIDWLVHMLAEDPLQRPNMQSAATHLWLAGEHVARPGLYTISDEPAKNLAERQQILSNLSFAPILEEDAEDPDLHYVHEG